MQFVAAAGVRRLNFAAALAVADLTHGGDGVIFVKQAAQVLQEAKVFRLVFVVEVFLMVIRVHRRRDVVVALFQWQRRVVAQLGIAVVEIHRVQTEAVHATVQPETGHIEQFLTHFGIMEIQVWLLGQEVVQVVLLAGGVPLPGWTAKDGEPVVGRRAVQLWFSPNKPIGLVVGTVCAAFNEPRVLIRGVGQDQVDDDLDAQFMRLGDQLIEV
mmetsp:Transcript_23592/g.41758  ORF Transcript_23592/g.41758 Transcript_23592/m.41758 type:complete len:213 (-) Transcript_23592:692-1330(-)